MVKWGQTHKKKQSPPTRLTPTYTPSYLSTPPQALNAQAAGAKGLILYSDPADYAIDDGSIQVYPDGWWLPETGAQRGSTFSSDAFGDPITPGYPAKRMSIPLKQALR